MLKMEFMHDLKFSKKSPPLQNVDFCLEMTYFSRKTEN